jgi:serine/threonine-protein kinase
MTAPPSPPLPPFAERSLVADRYRIERELGRGGMATVYLAEDVKHGRRVALKVLRAELGAAFGAERFLREIGIVARLQHPHVVPLIDSGDAGGLLYYVSAYVPGGSLRERLRHDGRLTVDDALAVAGDVAEALDHAHRQGVVHRDVKPENILFTDGHALLADFGIARRGDGEGEGADPVTEAGVAVGTPEYMSPEQASGERELGARSDVYSLACVVFEMLAGEPPFHGRSARATMAQHVASPPPRVRALRPEVPPAAEDALLRALAKDPERRFPSAHDFVAALRAEGNVAGRRLAAAAQPLRGIAVLPFVNSSPDPENEYLSDGITDELIDALAKVEGCASRRARRCSRSRGSRRTCARPARCSTAPTCWRESLGDPARSSASPRSSPPPTTGGCSGRSATTARSTTCSPCRTRSRARS